MSPEPSKAQLLSAFEDTIIKALKWYRSIKPRGVILVHHNDTDGLTAGSICARMFERDGTRLSRYCLEKPYPEALNRIFERGSLGDLVVLTDLASGMLSRLEQINLCALPVLVLDHHRVDKFSAPWLCVVNSTECGLDGGVDGSASAVAYRFALALSDHNKDLKPLALLGAFGDAQFTSALDARGLNALHLVEPLEIDGVGFSQLKLGLDVLGSYAYFQGGPDIALKLLSDQLSSSKWSVVEDQIAKFARERDKFLLTCKLDTTACLTSFSLNAFHDAGVKMVGLMCEELLARGKVGSAQYLLGDQILKDQIPGLGAVGVSGLKISMRVGEERWRLIQKGESPDVATVLSQATKAVGGFVDGCHRHAGAVTIASAAREEFLKLVLAGVGWCWLWFGVG